MHRDGFIGVEGDRKQGQVLDAVVLVGKYGEWNRPEAVKIEGRGNHEDKIILGLAANPIIYTAKGTTREGKFLGSGDKNVLFGES